MKTNQVKKYDFHKEGANDLNFCFQAGFLEDPETK